jgi:hypothetical protein
LEVRFEVIKKLLESVWVVANFVEKLDVFLSPNFKEGSRMVFGFFSPFNSKGGKSRALSRSPVFINTAEICIAYIPLFQLRIDSGCCWLPVCGGGGHRSLGLSLGLRRHFGERVKLVSFEKSSCTR